MAAVITAISNKWKASADQIEEIKISLEKTDVDVDELSVLWIPVG